MSEKIIVLHPENQPEVDIYPIIKEGSIPNSVIDNQKIKSRTIINSNIALNTLKYEVLHSTLKQLIDSKITQVNMENYLTSYYYNVEETQQYVGSEINTLHQTIQNEFYSNTTIDNMLMEKTDLSLFREYLPSTYLNLDKQQDNQTSKLNLHANGSIFLTNSGNKTNSGNYYLPNSIVKTEDATNGYFVLSTTNDDYQSLYNLGAYDKITTNDDGTYTITRQTGYSNNQYKLNTSYTEKVEKNYYARYNQKFILEHNKSEAERSANLIDIATLSGTTTAQNYFIITTKDITSILENNGERNYIFSAKLSNVPSNAISAIEIKRDWQYWKGTQITGNGNLIVSFTYEKGYTYQLVIYGNYGNGNGIVYTYTCSDIMLNEGSVALPYQAYEGKTIHEKDLESVKNEINNSKQDKLVSNENIKTINGQSILGSGDLKVTADSVFSQVTDVVDSFTINTNGTWLITCTGYNKIYASDNDTISFFGSALVSMTSASNNPHICINGTAYSCSSVITFVTSGILRVFKLN